MSEPQLVLLDAEGNPAFYPCPTCMGAGEALRLLYPDEREPGGAFVAIRRCPTCLGQGSVDFHPADLSRIPY